MTFKRAKELNKLLRVLCSRSITTDILWNEKKSSSTILDSKVAKDLGITIQRLNFLLRGLEQDDFVSVMLYQNETNLHHCLIKENGRDFIEHGGYVRKKAVTLSSKYLIGLTSIIALIFTGVNTINSCKQTRRATQIENKQMKVEKDVANISVRIDSINSKTLNRK